MSESNFPRRARDYRLAAREALRGKWLRLFLPMLLLMLIGGTLISASVEIPSSSYDWWFSHHIADFSVGGRSTQLIVYDEDYKKVYEYLEIPVPEVNITSPRPISLDLRLATAALVLIAVYLLFEKVVVNYRPILIEGKPEASYPSSTTLLVLSVMPTFLIQMNARIKREGLRKLAAVVILAFTVFMVGGRLISGVHWLSDILGGVLLSAGLVMLYAFARK